MNFYGEIILNLDALDIDRPFTYAIPENLINKVKIGQIVKVPFGMKNKPVEGVIINLHENSLDGKYKVKNIKSIETIEPIIGKDEVDLIYFLKNEYLCRYIDAIRLLIPVGIMRGAKKRSKNVLIFENDDISKFKNKEDYIDILKKIKESDILYTKSELVNKFSVSQYKINKLIENKNLRIEEEIIYRYNNKVYKEYLKEDLTEEQKNVLNKIKTSENNKFLLKGVTGSGKTEIYMTLIEEVLNENKSALVLVPEIALTTQMIERFKGRFGRDVALFHSKLSDGERFDEWYRVKEGKAKLVIGARSALFLPVQNIGIIVIDEEHENTYKSEQSPKYQAKEVAEFICDNKNAKLILGSATPSIETYYRAISGELELVELTKRVDSREMPKMKAINMAEELKSGNKSVFSRELYNDIKIALNKKEQIILFLNRRGFSTFVSCRSCGYVFKCQQCDISMTYHKNGYLTCHYCGNREKQPEQCPKCSSKYVKYFGAGTQSIEEEVKKYFKDAKVIRMDVDTTKDKESYDRLYNSFKNKEADILIGTQMISKGFDFKDVTLVGVLAADMSINIPDYRSTERTFQLITQVAGRSGRGEKEGKVIIQTYNPEHYVLKYIINYDYEGFYEEEFTVRAMMGYPPFGKILLINGYSKNESILKSYMEDILKILENEIKGNYNLEILGPIQCIISKIKDTYRWQIIIKGELDNIISKKIRDILYDSNKNNYNEIRISIDINPNNLI